MDYEVIIVGGRPTGASLAARLGARGIKVLVVDRATFPSLPAVPSSPALHAGAMKLVDEIGVAEASYGHPDAFMRTVRMDMAGIFQVEIPVPRMSGRAYSCGIDRITFDDALWKNLARFPSVERREGFHVTELLREGDRVIGVEGGPPGEARQRITAGCVVGADGRFSFVARRAGAEVMLEDDVHTSTVYYADWQGARAGEPHPFGYVYATARGLDILMFAMPDGRLCVNTHARSDRVQIDGDAERYYLSTLRSLGPVWQKLERGEMVTPVVGVKKIGNGYRRASGPGWVLAGDAVHYKDPVDGQGIYDALIGAKLLDRAIAVWCAGARTWDEAMSEYTIALWAATHPMFLATTGRLRRELYEEPPPAVIKTMIRWTLTDPVYQDTFLRVIGRDLPAEAMSSRAMMAGAIARGLGRDIAGALARLRG